MGKILRLVGRRLWQLLPIIVFATFVVFSLLQLVPGDPAVVLAGDYASEQRIAEIRQLYGLDQPFLVQYGVWLLHALEGNLGRSLLTSESVSKLILYRLPNTLLIAVYALVIAGVVGVALGVAAATRVGTRLDAFITGLASLGVALPSFWLAMILVATLSLGLHWFPTTGAAPLLTDPWSAIMHATLPAVALAVGVIAELARQVRSALIEVLNSQYIRTLRAQRPVVRRRPLEARPAQYQRDLTDAARPAGEPPVFRRGGDRGRVRDSRCRQPGRQLGAQQRLSGGAGRGPGAGGYRDPGQPFGRCAQRVARPTGG